MSVNKLKIGVISIPTAVRDQNRIGFKSLYQLIGMNTGNLMFTNAVFRQIVGDLTCLGFDLDPNKINTSCDIIVIPAANWFYEYANWDWLCDVLDKIEIPVVTIGVGVQALSNNIHEIKVSESSIRLSKIMSRKSSFIGVRGALTDRWLNSIGITNTVVIGCPSLYMRLSDQEVNSSSGVLLQSSRYLISGDSFFSGNLNREIYKYSFLNDEDIVFQSEPEEMKYILDLRSDCLSENTWKQLCDLYGANTTSELQDYLKRRGRVFYNLEDWVSFVQLHELSIGTRLHSAILALNSSVPALLIPHDSRTREIAEFAKMPSYSGECNWADYNFGKVDLNWLMDQCNSYKHHRHLNGLLYRDFLESNGLAANISGFLDVESIAD